MPKLVILGAGGHGRVAAEIAELCGWTDIVFLDAKTGQRSSNGPWPVIGDDSAQTLLSQPQGTKFFVGIGDNVVRSRLQLRIEELKLPMTNLIHPSAVVSRHASIDLGCLVAAGAVVNFGAQLGKGVIVNTHAGVDHDCRIGAFCHIAPAAHMAANVTLGERVFLGIGVSVKHGIDIGQDSVVGAGAAVVHNIAAQQTVVGVPAKAHAITERHSATKWTTL